MTLSEVLIVLISENWSYKEKFILFIYIFYFFYNDPHFLIYYFDNKNKVNFGYKNKLEFTVSEIEIIE